MEEIKNHDKLKNIEAKLIDCEKNKEECSKYKFRVIQQCYLLREIMAMLQNIIR